ncbi:MAG: hypothetical protein IT169_05405, partial [Bryobacterales bacterium]|nr:hypothetical protein [Bryobacterales bacterium]
KGNEPGVANSYFFQPKVHIKTPFLGSRKIWVLAVDNAGNHTGYQYVGQFNFTSAGLYDLELTPYYRRDPASGKRELWVRAEARRLPRGSTRANPENPGLEAQ